MKIYVIIPIYNEDSFLEKSINSFIDQTYTPKKVVYVDDNSTDSSKNIVSKYSQKFDWIELIGGMRRDARLGRELGDGHGF